MGDEPRLLELDVVLAVGVGDVSRAWIALDEGVLAGDPGRPQRVGEALVHFGWQLPDAMSSGVSCGWSAVSTVVGGRVGFARRSCAKVASQRCTSVSTGTPTVASETYVRTYAAMPIARPVG